MNKLAITFLISTFLLSGCLYKYNTNVNEVIESRSQNHSKEIKIQGYLTIKDLAFMSLNSNKNDESEEEHIDVVINSDSQVNIKLKYDKYVCAKIIGDFYEYQADSIVVGNSTSKYGVVVVKTANKCQKME